MSSDEKHVDVDSDSDSDEDMGMFQNTLKARDALDDKVEEFEKDFKVENLEVTKPVSVLVLGCTGHGKSSLINLLMAEDNMAQVTDAAMQMNFLTYENSYLEQRVIHVNGLAMNLQCVDTIGLGDTKHTEQAITKGLKLLMKKECNTFTHVFFVVKIGKWRPETQKNYFAIMKFIRDILGFADENIKIILTCKDFINNEIVKKHVDYIKENFKATKNEFLAISSPNLSEMVTDAVDPYHKVRELSRELLYEMLLKRVEPVHAYENWQKNRGTLEKFPTEADVKNLKEIEELNQKKKKRWFRRKKKNRQHSVMDLLAENKMNAVNIREEQMKRVAELRKKTKNVSTTETKQLLVLGRSGSGKTSVINMLMSQKFDAKICDPNSNPAFSDSPPMIYETVNIKDTVGESDDKKVNMSVTAIECGAVDGTEKYWNDCYQELNYMFSKKVPTISHIFFCIKLERRTKEHGIEIQKFTEFLHSKNFPINQVIFVITFSDLNHDTSLQNHKAEMQLLLKTKPEETNLAYVCCPDLYTLNCNGTLLMIEPIKLSKKLLRSYLLQPFKLISMTSGPQKQVDFKVAVTKKNMNSYNPEEAKEIEGLFEQCIGQLKNVKREIRKVKKAYKKKLEDKFMYDQCRGELIKLWNQKLRIVNQLEIYDSKMNTHNLLKRK